MEKFRVISDLHLDINKKYPINVRRDGIFTVIAGDTSGHSHILDFKKNSKVSMYVYNDETLLDYIGKHCGKVEFQYSPTDKCWTYKGNPIDCKKAGIELHSLLALDSNDKISFTIFDVEKWIRKTISKGIIIAGNHLVYNNHHHTIEELKDNLHNRFPIDSDITFLDNSVGVMSKEIDGIVFVGSTLYTDYKYMNEKCRRYLKVNSEQEKIDTNIRLASPRMSGGGLNDFNFGRTTEGTYKKSEFDDDNGIYWITPKNYLNFFNRTMEELTKIVECNKDKPIVIVTHHCPSQRCISNDYVDSFLNASYISDLEDFIINHTNIKCWCCGHVHHRDDFQIGKCRIVMNPLGYCKYGQFRNNTENKTTWSFNTFVNTKTWEVEYEPFDLTKWNKTYDNTFH